MISQNSQLMFFLTPSPIHKFCTNNTVYLFFLAMLARRLFPARKVKTPSKAR